MDVCEPVTEADIAFCPEALIWFSKIPVLKLSPFPAMVRLKSVKDLVNDVPSTETAVLPGPAELIAQGPMINGSAVVPEPPVTQLHA
jgi:hypothetical protein